MPEDTIKLNDIEYIKKDSYSQIQKELFEIKEKLEILNYNTNKEVKRFPIEQEVKLLKLLSKLFSPSNDVSEDYLVKNDKLVVDPANVVGVLGKTEEAKRILSRFLDRTNEKENPNLDYKIDGIATSKFGLEYINKILAILNIDSDAVRFTTKFDFPLKIENHHFTFILAPRINGDDENYGDKD